MFTLRLFFLKGRLPSLTDFENYIFVYRRDLTITCDIYIESNNGGAFIAGRINKAGQFVAVATGVFFWVFPDGTYKVTSDIGT